ncbi:glycosyltransferase family 4 protein [Patescibacteria group bacterium]|nr:glycosyltransferase family 4 protein [Patescibacteria group bacterium]
MRIAHVVSTFPPKVGGMGNVCYNEAKILSERGHDVTVFTLEYPNIQEIDLPFKVVHLKAILRLGDAGLVPQLIAKLKNFDIAHLHYPFYGGAEWVWFAKILNKQKYVVTYHMDALPTTITKLCVQKVYDIIFPRLILNGAEKVIAVDKEHLLQTKFGRKIYPEKVVEIQNAVDLDVFRPHEVSLEQLNLGRFENKKIILFVGNALKVKRLDIAIQSVEKLDNTALLVVGGGYEITAYREMIQDSALKDKIFFAGYCTDVNKLSDYYNIADCVIIPSDAESFSLVALEAMACGKPVVGSDIPALRARINNGIDGLLARPGSVEDFVNKISSVLASTSSDIKRKEGVARNFGWDKHVDKLMKNYNYQN